MHEMSALNGGATAGFAKTRQNRKKSPKAPFSKAFSLNGKKLGGIWPEGCLTLS